MAILTHRGRPATTTNSSVVRTPAASPDHATPIAEQRSSGSVQPILKSPARQCVLPLAGRSPPRRQPKNALHYRVLLDVTLRHLAPPSRRTACRFCHRRGLSSPASSIPTPAGPADGPSGASSTGTSSRTSNWAGSPPGAAGRFIEELPGSVAAKNPGPPSSSSETDSADAGDGDTETSSSGSRSESRWLGYPGAGPPNGQRARPGRPFNAFDLATVLVTRSAAARPRALVFD